jgi:hypothetical protein
MDVHLLDELDGGKKERKKERLTIQWTIDSTENCCFQTFLLLSPSSFFIVFVACPLKMSF